MKPKGFEITPIMFLIATVTLYIVAITIPISSETNDVFIDTIIEKPINVVIPQPLTFKDISATVARSTFLETPNLGCIAGCSGSIKITASTTSVTSQVNIEPIYITSTTNARIVLRKVPVDETLVTIRLYEDNVLRSTKEIIIP